MLERINQARPGRPELGSPIWWEQNIPLIKFDSFKPAELVARSEASLETKTGKGRLRVLDSAKAGLRRLHNWLLEECGPSIDGEFTAQKTPATPEVRSIQVLTTSDESPIVQTTPEPPANNKLENLKAAVDERKKTINMIKAGLSQVYAGEDRLMVGGKDIFASARRQRKKYPEKPEKFADSISRALLKVAKNEDWVATLPIVTQRVLFKLQAEQEVLRKDSKDLSREKSKEKKRLTNIALQSQTKKVEPVPTLEQNLVLESPPAEVLSRKDKQPEAVDKRPRSAVLRRAAVFGLVAAAVAVALFVKDTPQVSDFLKTVVDIRPGVTQAKGETALPLDIKALQKRIDELTESNNAYRAESQERFAQLVEARMAAAGYIPGELRRIGLENRKLTEQNQNLQQQLDEARAAASNYPEYRWVSAVEPVNGRVIDGTPGNIRTTFDTRYTIKTGDTLEGVAREIGRSFKLDSETAIFLLAQKEARDNRKRSTYLGTKGEVSDTALLPGEVLDLGGTLALAEQMSPKPILN